MICNVVGFNGKVVFDISMPEGAPRKALDTSKLNNLGWRAKTPIEQGLKKSFSAYLNQINQSESL